MQIRTYYQIAGPQLDKALLWLASFVVVVDWLNGVLFHQLGSSYGFSALVKAVLLSGMVYRSWELCRAELRWPLALMLLMCLGPFYVSLLQPHSFFLADVQLIFKTGAFLLALAYFCAIARLYPQRFLCHVDWFVLGSYLLLLLNSTLGMAGYGGTAYQPMDEVAQKFLGIKGFFISTNELSALLLILTSWLLLRSWQVKRWCYPLISITSLLIAGLLLTKTGLFGCVLLIIAVPLLLTPKAVYQSHRKTLLVLAIVLTGLFLLLLLNLTALLQWVGIYDKLMFAYQQRGIAGIVLSSRDYYLQRNFITVADNYPAWLQLFGVGQGGVRLLLKKYFIELDLFDMLLFYGLAGALLYGLTFWRVLALAGSRLWQVSAAVPVLLLNLILLSVSLLAGHIVTSGMLWVPWALINAAVIAQVTLRNQVLTQPVTESTSDERLT